MTEALAERALDSLRNLEKLRSTEPTQTIAVLAEAKVSYFGTMEAYKRLGIHPADYLGPIWANNLQRHLIPNIRQCQSVEQAIAYLNDKAFYDFSCGEPYLTPSLHWRLEFLASRYGCTVDELPAELCESPFVLQKHCKRFNSRLISSDFLNRLAWVCRLERVLDFPEHAFTILEVGGGFGALSRVFRLVYPQSKHVVVDIPESLFFQHAFLKGSFPEARHQYITGPDDVVNESADFVYVPNCFAGVLKDREFFLAVNTNSFGEMPEAASSRWLDLIERETRTENIFFLNRFLNRITQPMLETRHGHSSWSFMLGEGWSIHEWEVDPDYERCPYFQTTLTRNLHIVASRGAMADAEAAALKARGENIRLEDWSLRPGWDDFKFKTGADYPPLMSRADLDLTPDLTKTGTLYALWSLMRLTRDPQWFAMLVGYLDYLNGQQAEVFFEEIPTLMQMRALLPQT
jgi:hypothetical protein